MTTMSTATLQKRQTANPIKGGAKAPPPSQTNPPLNNTGGDTMKAAHEAVLNSKIMVAEQRAGLTVTQERDPHTDGYPWSVWFTGWLIPTPDGGADAKLCAEQAQVYAMLKSWCDAAPAFGIDASMARNRATGEVRIVSTGWER